MGGRRTIWLADAPNAAAARLRASMLDVDFRALPEPGARDGRAQANVAAAAVWLNGDPDAAFRTVRQLDAAGLRVVVVGAQKEADVILRAMREGAKEFVLASDEPALGHALRQLARAPGDGGTASVHAIFAAKGGVGATTLATNLAGALEARGARTCLVDLNLAMGDVLAFLDLSGGYSIADLIGNMQRLDDELLEATLLRHASGVRVLAQSHRVEDSERVTPDGISALLHFLSAHFDAVVLDGLRNFDEAALSALDASDRAVLLLTPEVPAVRDARRCVDLFRRIGCDQKLLVAVNRFEKGQEIDRDVVQETIGVPVAATLANDYGSVIRAVNRGVLVVEDAPRSAFARDVASLATTLGAGVRDGAPAAKRSLIGRIFRGRGAHAAG